MILELNPFKTHIQPEAHKTMLYLKFEEIGELI